MVDARPRTRRGISFIEVLVASLLVSVSIAGLISLWRVCDLSIRGTGEINQAAQIARQELERVKAYGPANFPKGTLACSTGDGATWTGAYSATSGAWTSGGTAYFDYQGNSLTSSTGAAFSMQVTVTDSGDLPPSPCTSGSTTTGYDIVNTTRRYALAAVTRLRDNTILFTSGTEMVVGGL